jgi:thioredoxin reductase
MLVDDFQKTSVPGIYAVGDATTPMRSVSSAVAAGTLAGAMLNRELLSPAA